MFHKPILFTCLFGLGVLVSGAAQAQSMSPQGEQNSATYEVRGVVCNAGDCRAIVSNEHGWGVVVEGQGKKRTKKKAEKKADELNEEATSEGVESVIDTCLFFPELCV